MHGNAVSHVACVARGRTTAIGVRKDMARDMPAWDQSMASSKYGVLLVLCSHPPIAYVVCGVLYGLCVLVTPTPVWASFRSP